jgi:hypothetical protein
MRNPGPIESMTIGNMRALGVRNLDAYCSAIGCNHEGQVAGDHFPDAVPVPSIARRLVCSRCGSRAATIRPDWREMRTPGMGA